MPTLHAAFFDRAAADHAVDDLLARGTAAGDISLLMSDATKQKFATSFEGPVAVGGVTGGAVGGGLAAIAGGLLAGGALTIATGGLAAPFLVVGPLAGALIGGVSGVAVGTLLGALTGAGVATADAADMESGVNKGAVVLAVEVSEADAAAVTAILRRDGGSA